MRVPTGTEPKRFSSVETRMAQDEDPTEISGTEARGGATPHVTRYVLGISLILIIVLFAAVLLWGGR